MNHYLWKARAYYRQVAGLLMLGTLSGITCNVAVILPAMFLGRAIDAVVASESGRAASVDVMNAAVPYVAGSALYFLARIGKRWWLRTAVQRTIASIRNDALRGVLSWPMEALHRQSVGDTMARIIGDTRVFGSGFNESTTELLDTWLFSFSLIAAMLSYAPRLTLLSLLPVPVALWLAYMTRGWVRSRTRASREANSELTAALQERLAGVRVLRLFGRADTAVERTETLSRRLERANLAETRLQVALQPVYSILVTCGVFLVIWLGGRNVIEGAMTTGSLVAFLQLYLRFVLRGHRLPLFFNRLQSAGVAWERLEGLLTEPPAIEDEPPLASFRPAHVAGLLAELPEPAEYLGGALSVELDGVSFRYPDGAAQALDDVSLQIPAGELLAITGPVGSGKSALLRVLMGLYDVDGGSVCVGGRRMGDLSLDERATRIGYLPQDTGLFSGPVLANIRPDDEGSPVSDRMRRIIEVSSLEQDLEQFPEGIHTQIGEGGIRVSGGQRQRIALARALSVSGDRAPGLLLLDDPFSSIDVDTEGEIIGALRDAFGPEAPLDRRATIVLCSHRLAAFRHADQIVVLDRGRIVEQGTHQNMVTGGGLYERIYNAQRQMVNVDGAESSP